MTADLSPDLDAATLIARIEAGAVGRDFLLIVARGFLPMPQEDLVSVLLHLTRSEDADIAELSRGSLKELPPRIVLNVARNSEVDPLQLDALAHATNDATLLEAVIRNRSTSDDTIERLAARVAGGLQDVIVINQERILRRPSILDSLLANPALTPDIRRRALEVREEFFEKKQSQRRVEPATGKPEIGLDDELLELTPEQQAELDALVGEAEALPPQPPPEVPPNVDDDDQDSVFRRILKMTVAQKVQRAYKGGLTERSILIRERNRLICSAVIRSPRLTESEVEAFAGMRNIEEEALRLIGMNRQWMAKYSIMTALVRNPKAPIGVVLPLINRLTLKDLKFLSSDKGVSEAVRSASRRLYVARRSQ